MKRILPSIFFCAALLLLLGFSASVSRATDDQSLVVKDKCISCHGLAKTCTNLGMDELWWGETLTRMLKRGADIDAAQVELLTPYLAHPGPDMLQACGKE